MKFPGRRSVAVFTIQGLKCEKTVLAFLKVVGVGGIFWPSCDAIWTNDMVTRRASSKFVPRLITRKLNECRLSQSSYMFDYTESDERFLKITQSLISSSILKRINSLIGFTPPFLGVRWCALYVLVSDGNKEQTQSAMHVPKHTFLTGFLLNSNVIYKQPQYNHGYP